MNFEAIPPFPQWKLCRRGLVPASIGAHRPGFICQSDGSKVWNVNQQHGPCRFDPICAWTVASTTSSNHIEIMNKSSLILFQSVHRVPKCPTLWTLKSTLQTARPLLSVAIVGPCLSGLRLKVRFDAFDRAHLKWVLGPRIQPLRPEKKWWCEIPTNCRRDETFQF